jgi:hypothetical protein
MKTKVVLILLIAASLISVCAHADGIDGTWASKLIRAYDGRPYKTYEINLKGDNVCTIRQTSINYDDALIITVLHDCVADMSSMTLTYRVYLAQMVNVNGKRKDYEYDKYAKDTKMYSAPFVVNGNELIIGNEKFYKQ